MKSSSEITAKLVAATLLTGVFSLSQTEACEGLRVDSTQTLRNVAEAVSETKIERPANWVDGRTVVAPPLSPVGRVVIGKDGPKQTGNLIKVPGMSENAGSCYMLTSKHILQQKNFESAAIAPTDSGDQPDLLAYDIATLSTLPEAKVNFIFGEKFAYQVSGRIVGGGKSRDSITAEEKKKFGPTMVDEDEDWMLVRLDKTIGPKLAKPYELPENKEDLQGHNQQGKEVEVSSVGLPGEKIREFGGQLQLFEDKCSAGTLKEGRRYYFQSGCTGTSGSSGTGLVSDNIIVTLQTKLHYRDGFKSAFASGTKGPSIAHLAEDIEKIMKDNPCPR
ncbi:MAG: hypothetical protein JNM39_00575 [Bdellovibrionaceae bacterium]|nr:hypothetical protein [Pseudobdellovibrionaceae bacterium]